MSDITNPDGSTLTEVEFSDDFTDWNNLPTDEIVQHLLGYICPAGLPHTGPDALEGHDHGHTVCFFIGLAIKRIHNLVLENEQLKARLNPGPCTSTLHVTGYCCRDCGKHATPHRGCILR